MSNESGGRRLPLVVEQGLASTRLARARLASDFSLAVGLDNTTCRKGCVHCCTYPVVISLWEGIALYQGLKASGLWKSQLKHDLEHHSKLTFGTAPEVWLLSSIPCPLLVDNLCSAYDQRPLRCRVTASTRNPDFCRSVYFNEGTFEDNSKPLWDFAVVEEKAARSSREQVRGMAQRVPVSTAVLVGYEIVEERIRLEEVPASLLRLWGSS